MWGGGVYGMGGGRVVKSVRKKVLKKGPKKGQKKDAKKAWEKAGPLNKLTPPTIIPVLYLGSSRSFKKKTPM